MDAFNGFRGKILDGRYRIEEAVGSGGMANVFAATDLTTGRKVAIKMLKDAAAAEPKTLKRFINESRAISMLDHKNIVKIYDINVEGVYKYIVMEYIDGMTLRDYLSYRHTIDWRDAVIYCQQVLAALDHAHSKGVVHRDIKPANIMILEKGIIKVTDFGIAKIIDGRATSTLTANTAIGTVYYISPEQAQNQKIDSRSDLYSLGCMLYEMVTGKLPFVADSSLAIILKQVKDDPVPPSQINPKIPLGLEQIILCAMQKNPQNRYQSAAQMLRNLQTLMRDPTTVFIMKKPTPKTPTSDETVNKTGKASNNNREYYEENTPPKRVAPPPVKQQPVSYAKPQQSQYPVRTKAPQQRPQQDPRRMQQPSGQRPHQSSGQARPQNVQQRPRPSSAQQVRQQPQQHSQQSGSHKKNSTLSTAKIILVFMIFLAVILGIFLLIYILFIQPNLAQTATGFYNTAWNIPPDISNLV